MVELAVVARVPRSGIFDNADAEVAGIGVETAIAVAGKRGDDSEAEIDETGAGRAGVALPSEDISVAAVETNRAEEAEREAETLAGACEETGIAVAGNRDGGVAAGVAVVEIAETGIAVAGNRAEEAAAEIAVRETDDGFAGVAFAGENARSVAAEFDGAEAGVNEAETEKTDARAGTGIAAEGTSADDAATELAETGGGFAGVAFARENAFTAAAEGDGAEIEADKAETEIADVVAETE